MVLFIPSMQHKHDFLRNYRFINIRNSWLASKWLKIGNISKKSEVRKFYLDSTWEYGFCS